MSTTETKRNVRSADDRLKGASLIEAIKLELLLKPDDVILNNNLAVEYVGFERYDEALEILERMVQLNPTNSGLYSNLGVVYDSLNRASEAHVAMQKAIDLDSTNFLARDLQCAFFLRQEDFANGASCYEKKHTAAPGSAESFASYGLCLIGGKQTEKTLEMLTTQMRLFPRSTHLYNVLGIVHYIKKNKERSIEAFTRALEIDPANTEASFNLGVVEHHSKNKNEAVRQYLTLKDSNPHLARQLYKLIYSDKLVFVDKNIGAAK